MEPSTATALHLLLRSPLAGFSFSCCLCSHSDTSRAPLVGHASPDPLYFSFLAAIRILHSFALLFLEPQLITILRTPSARLPAHQFSLSGLHTPVLLAHPKSATGPSASLAPLPLCLEGHWLQPALAESLLPATGLSPPGSAKTRVIFPLPPRPREPLYLQL